MLLLFQCYQLDHLQYFIHDKFSAALANSDLVILVTIFQDLRQNWYTFWLSMPGRLALKLLFLKDISQIQIIVVWKFQQK